MTRQTLSLMCPAATGHTAQILPARHSICSERTQQRTDTRNTHGTTDHGSADNTGTRPTGLNAEALRMHWSPVPQLSHPAPWLPRPVSALATGCKHQRNRRSKSRPFTGSPGRGGPPGRPASGTAADPVQTHVTRASGLRNCSQSRVAKSRCRVSVRQSEGFLRIRQNRGRSHQWSWQHHQRGGGHSNVLQSLTCCC